MLLLLLGMHEKGDALKRVGPNIRAIRKARLMKQLDLARKLDMRPGPVSCLEKGKNLPSTPVLLKLSKILDVPVDAFFSATPSAYLEAAPYPAADSARKKGRLYAGPCDLPARSDAERADLSETLFAEPFAGMANRIAETYLAAETFCEAHQGADICLGTDFDGDEPGLIRLAQRVRLLCGTGDTVPFDLAALLEAAGLRLVFCSMPFGHDSIAYGDLACRSAFVFVNSDSKTGAERQRYLLAYELGRLHLHAPGWHKTRDAAIDAQSADWLAHRFAALFLLPETSLRLALARLGIGPGSWSPELLYRIKRKLAVPARTLLERLSELKLIDPAIHMRLQDELQAAPSAPRTLEPQPLPNLPSMNGRLADLLFLAAQSVRRKDESARIRKIAKELKLVLPDI